MLKKNQIEIMVAVVLGVVLVALAVGKFFPRQPPSTSGLKGMAVGTISPAKTKSEQDSNGPLYVVLHQATKDFKFSRDPFNPPPVVPTEGPVKLNLMGILWDPQQPTAIINNEIVQIGSKIAGHVVVDIQESKVIVNDRGNNLELTIPKF